MRKRDAHKLTQATARESGGENGEPSKNLLHASELRMRMNLFEWMNTHSTELYLKTSCDFAVWVAVIPLRVADVGY